MTQQRRLGEMLMTEGLLERSQLNGALVFQSKFGGKLGDILVEAGYIDRDALSVVLARRLGVELVRLGRRRIPANVLGCIPRELILRHRVLPFELVQGPRRNILVAACADPVDENLRRALRAHARLIDVRLVLATPNDLDATLAANGLLAARRELDLPDDDGSGANVGIFHFSR